MATYATLNELFSHRVESPTIRRLLLAGVDAFWRDGFHASSTRDIAKRAQRSPAAVYVHFKAKEDLLFDIIRYLAEYLLDRLRESAAEGGDPTEMLSRLVHAYVALPARTYKASLVANREFWSLTAAQQKQVVKIRDELEEIVGNCLAAGKASGEFDFKDLSITRMAVVSLCRSTLLWYSPRGRLTPEQLGDEYVHLVLGMVRAKAIDDVAEEPVRARAAG
ncbi:MAG: TetR/AcrR family transcriptional regulator [Gammaproteobacteria bacterium]|nr:TetR/AcrR family transcriptional regulator [Gammaproteobacteria bacterium]MBU1444034.1 TetR/AcrR family transcriptional regulator [Gammaproteobacteria bacterium]MBU2288492.1 TetR/AcrR family transcriptional regulator [Gammaproteobacteria bacterium]MBU2409776.1 TetR/AcrR family transcriptional regulator [Gammaproteobacteria bacterium]